LGTVFQPTVGTMLMLSVPPAMMQSAMPAEILPTAIAMVSTPEPQ